MAAGQQQDEEEIVSINVTPLVDITLVLLIIFVVTASFIVRETVEVDLPRAAHGGETVQGLVNVVMDKEAQLYFDGTKLERTFRVATGQSSYPTPVGSFEIVTMQRHPWWYPPQGSAWAAGKQPVPPGPGNPLGTRWMGISAPYVGIHGTPDAASIGYSASHGCVRMLIPQVEWLFEQVDVGTPVFIVAA